MIRMEYDAPTAGTRVSFVVKDGEHSDPLVRVGWSTLMTMGQSNEDGTWSFEQNPTTLKAVMQMVVGVLGSETEAAKQLESFRAEADKEEAARLEAEEDERRLKAMDP